MFLRLRTIPAHSVQIYICILPLQKLLRNCDFISTSKFAENVCISIVAFFWSLGESWLCKYSSRSLAISILSTKIIVFGIEKVAEQGDITKSSSSKLGFLISNMRYMILVTLCIVAQALKAAKTLKYILIHLMLPLLRVPKSALLEMCFSNN